MNDAPIAIAQRSPASTGLDPFVHAQGPNSYFETPAIRQRIDLVRHLVEFGRQIIVISGPPGAGKSAMLARVCDDAGVSWHLLRFIGGPALNQITLLTKIADELGIPKPADKTQLLDSIRRAIKAANTRGETIILTVDDAHKLPSDTPGGLAELAHGSDESAELKIIVAADPSQTRLVEHLQQGTSGQTLVHVVEVPRFNNLQTHELLKHRWNAAYATDEVPLSDAEIAQIYQQSNGVPGKAIVLARQVQILSEQRNRPRPDPARRYVLIGAALVAMFLIFAFFNAEKSTREQGVEVTLELATMAGDTELVDPSPRSVKRPLQPVTTQRAPEITQRDQEISLGTNLIELQTTAPHLPSQTPIPTTLSSELSQTTTELEEKPKATPQATDVDLVSKELIAGPKSKVKVVLRTPEPAPERAAAAPVAIEPPKNIEITAKTEPKESEKAQSTVENTGYSIDWLLQQPNTGYVLQLFGGRNRSAAEKFIRDKEIAADSDLLITEHAGGPWYVVVYKYFPDRIAAQRAIRELSPILASTKPWSRPISSLK